MDSGLRPNSTLGVPCGNCACRRSRSSWGWRGDRTSTTRGARPRGPWSGVIWSSIRCWPRGTWANRRRGLRAPRPSECVPTRASRILRFRGSWTWCAGSSCGITARRTCAAKGCRYSPPSRRPPRLRPNGSSPGAWPPSRAPGGSPRGPWRGRWWSRTPRPARSWRSWEDVTRRPRASIGRSTPGGPSGPWSSRRCICRRCCPGRDSLP